jgi:hypothetical protein
MRDWVRAARDLQAAESRGDTADVLVEATLVVARAHARVRSIAGHAS